MYFISVMTLTNLYNHIFMGAKNMYTFEQRFTKGTNCLFCFTHEVVFHFLLRNLLKWLFLHDIFVIVDNIFQSRHACLIFKRQYHVSQKI